MNDAIAFALKEMMNEMEGKETEECKRKLYSWQAQKANHSNDKETNRQNDDINKSLRMSSVSTPKPFLRTGLDPGSPAFLPKDRTPSKGDKQTAILDPSSPEFTPSAVVALPPSKTHLNPVSECSEVWQEPNLDYFVPAPYVPERSRGPDFYSKNASSQTWLPSLVDVACNTPTVKMKDRSVETWTCDSREVGINTTEMFELEDDDDVIIPLNDIRTKLVETQVRKDLSFH